MSKTRKATWWKSQAWIPWPKLKERLLHVKQLQNLCSVLNNTTGRSSRCGLEEAPTSPMDGKMRWSKKLQSPQAAAFQLSIYIPPSLCKNAAVNKCRPGWEVLMVFQHPPYWRMGRTCSPSYVQPVGKSRDGHNEWWLPDLAFPSFSGSPYSPWSESGTWWPHRPRTSHTDGFTIFLNAWYRENDEGALAIKQPWLTRSVTAAGWN